jgi:putative membrane-bound dehydrogenase-like protein
MRCRGLLILWMAMVPVGRTVPAAEVELNGHVFTLPDGFEITVAAGPPLVDRPITADFDERGRLYVSDSSGSNDKVATQLEERPHRILRLEDSDGDGVFDRRTVFADRMMFPEGTLWYAGSLYVAAPPSIWKLTDTDDNGVADLREEWFQGKTLTGCANDLHGPYLGPDGWIYWCKGAFAEQTYERPGQAPWTTRASHIFRCRPDGSLLEPVMTGGMDNPVDVAFTPGGDRIFTTTFLVHPGGGQRDGLIHAVYGGVYGKIHSVLDGHPRTGDVLPVLSHLGPAAPCGLTCYQSTAFGDDYQHNLFACLFNLHKVTRHELAPHGSTYQSRDGDFLVSNNVDFHPTDVIEDADGSLLVVDTGGWYKLCCPTSQLWKPDILGAVYRVRRSGAARVDDPRGAKIAWDLQTAGQLWDLIFDPRPAVRSRATDRLGAMGPSAVGVLAPTPRFPAKPILRREDVWALCRIDSSDARQAIRGAFDDADATVVQAAVHCASLWRDEGALDGLIALLSHPSHVVRRESAEALGRLGDPTAVPALLKAASAENDRMLEHSLAYALIEIADRDSTAVGLASASPRTRRAALLALDQMVEGGLESRTVKEFLGSGESLDRETASWIVERHPEWADDLAGLLASRLAHSNLNSEEQAELIRQLARFSKAASVQQLLATVVGDHSAPEAGRRLALEAMVRSTLAELPATWVESLLVVLLEKPAGLVGPAVAVARTIAPPKDRTADVAKALLDVGESESVALGVRLEALAGMPGGVTDVSDRMFETLVAALGPTVELRERTLAAEVIGRSRMTEEQLTRLTERLGEVGPIETNRLLAVFNECTDETTGIALVSALEGAPSLAGLRVDVLTLALGKFPESVRKKGKALFAALNVDPDAQRVRLEGMLASLDEGDVRRGFKVFHSQKAACAACHQMGYVGGNAGPDLTRIGQVRTRRDLLESIVFPSLSFVRSYESTLVVTRDGKVVNGLIKSDTDGLLVLATAPFEEVRIPKSEVEEMQPGTVSVMPSGLDQQLSAQDLADLLAFLMAAK